MRVNAARLKEAVDSQGRRVSWLADKAGVSTWTIRRAIQGKYNPSLSVIKLLAVALNVPESELLAENTSPTATKTELSRS